LPRRLSCDVKPPSSNVKPDPGAWSYRAGHADASRAAISKDPTMNFLDHALFPEHQEKLVITAAPYGPEWMPEDFPEDLPLTMQEHVQAAVDCYNAGASILHLHVRELDGKGSKRLSKFNELIAGVRAAVPEMVIQVGGSISFAPESDGAEAKWLSDDTRHMLADLDPKPDQVTVAVSSVQMNVTELMVPADIRGTSFEDPAIYQAYREMTIPAGPGWVEEHLKRLQASGIQPHFQIVNVPHLETLERFIRKGAYTGPLNVTWNAIGGGSDGPNPYSMMEFIRRVPDGATLTLETIMRSVLPLNTMAIAMGLHCRCGNEDNIWAPNGRDRWTSVQQVEALVRIARELGREIADGRDAQRIYRIGEQYRNADETLAKLGYAPNRAPANAQLRRVA
jgi:uncharacterized protein (DUF849 family)